MCNFPDIRVLLVDDSAIWRTCVVKHLHRAGLKMIEVAYDGVQGVFKARTLQPDLILMDVGLPHMNGIEAAALIRGVAPNTKVIFVSANTDPQVRLAALNAGGCDYVLKAHAGDELINVMKLVLRGAETA